jgi:hypothetical protein
MIVTFSSKAAGDVIMFGDVAHRLMKIMGKEADAKGIITVEQLPEAIAHLRAAIAADKEARAAQAAEDEVNGDHGDTGRPAPISLAQRAVPLLELLEWAHKKQKPVVWGV